MTELTQDLSMAQALSLIDSYAFDLGGDDAEQILRYWLNLYRASWIRLATIEALYLGRYKAISIEHILSVWLRLGTPNTHFTYEFERLICRKLPKHLSDLSDLTISTTKMATINLDQPNYQQNHQKSALKTSVKSVRQVDTEQSKTNITKSDILSLQAALPKRNSSRQTKVSLISALGFSSQPDWSEFTGGNKMIHQFIPLPDVSSFFNKLKTFGEEKLERQ